MNLIAAVDKNWAIGKDNKLLVSIPMDMKFFRETTTGKVVVMGRKTLESFPNGLPLKNRTNIVLTHNKNYDGKGAIVIGLAAIFIGLSVSLKIKPNFVVSLIGVVGGGIIYYIIYNFVILMGLKTDYLKMLSALIVAVFLAVPYLKGRYFTKPIQAAKPSDNVTGGDANA